MALLADDGFGLFAGLNVFPKKSVLSEILLTNATRSSPNALITRHARRMLIENALSGTVRCFHIDALSSAVGLKVDFDMTLLVVASGLCRLLAGRMRGYGEAQARQIFRDLVAMPATVTVTGDKVEVSFHRRSHLSIVLASGPMEQPVAVPWWGGRGRRLRLTTYNGPTSTTASQANSRPWKSRLATSN